jgi:hypothetical protein
VLPYGLKTSHLLTRSLGELDGHVHRVSRADSLASSPERLVPRGMSPNAYPFTTRRQILERIEAEPSFATECIAILQERHDRRGAGGNESMGWMASHASAATKLAARLASGEATEKDRLEAAKVASRYSKQLAPRLSRA